MMLETFGTLLKEARVERGLTQLQLARPAEVNFSYIARLEMDERHPSRPVVLRLARVLNLSPLETDRLLVSANHAPEGDITDLLESGITTVHPLLAHVTQSLKSLSPEDQEKLGAEITAYVAFLLERNKSR